MTRSSFSVRSALRLAVFGCLLPGCSLFRSLNADQCQKDAECKQFGVDYTCGSDQVCVAPMANAGGNAAVAGSGGDMSGGTGGGAIAECAENADCIDAHGGAPYICQRGACVSLTVETHCPFVIAGTETAPTSYLTQPGKPIIIGAYVPIGVAAPESHPYTLNYRFALEEFMSGTLGGPGSPHRPIVIVLCQSNQPDLEASIGHLATTLEVPGILATLPSTDLAAAYDQMIATGRKVFMLGPFEADTNLITQDGATGLMWHMLGPTTGLIPVYAPLVAAAEKYVHTYQNVGAQIKVAVVNSDLSYSKEMAAALPGAVQVNGSLLSSSANTSNYLRFQVNVDGVPSPDVSAVVNKLGPKGSADIIISLGGAEFVNAIVPQIQAARAGVSDSPFYILSPSNTFAPQLTSLSYFMPQTMAYANTLMAGVNYASVVDDTLYRGYLAAIQARFPGVAGLESRENIYDAAYFMFYALAAASVGAEDFDGSDVAAGMKHLVQIGSNPVTVGPGPNGDMFVKVLTYLTLGSDVELDGTLGPPDFNLGTGARKSPGSVWCVDKHVPDPPSIKFDALRLQPPSNTSLALAPGDAFCFENFFP